MYENQQPSRQSIFDADAGNRGNRGMAMAEAFRKDSVTTHCRRTKTRENLKIESTGPNGRPTTAVPIICREFSANTAVVNHLKSFKI